MSLISSMHLLFARWNRVRLGLLLAGCCVFAEEMFVSQKSVAAPCHCPKSIDQLCLVLHPHLHFLTFSSISYPFLRFCSLTKPSRRLIPEFPEKRAMASYYQVDFISSPCTGLKIAALWEVIQKQESLPCPAPPQGCPVHRVERWVPGRGNGFG